MGYLEEICRTRFDILIHASTTQKIICSFELSLFSCILTFVYQLIVKGMCAFIHQCHYSCGPSSHSILEWLGETNSGTSSISRIGSKQLYSADQNAIQFLFRFTLECYHLYIKIIMGIAHHPMNSWCSDTSLHHYSFLGSRVVITGLSTSESWCVKSILLATLLLGS